MHSWQKRHKSIVVFFHISRQRMLIWSILVNGLLARRRKAVPDTWGLRMPPARPWGCWEMHCLPPSPKLGLGVLVLNISCFTEHQYLSRLLCDLVTRPLHYHVWTQTKQWTLSSLHKWPSLPLSWLKYVCLQLLCQLQLLLQPTLPSFCVRFPEISNDRITHTSWQLQSRTFFFSPLQS